MKKFLLHEKFSVLAAVGLSMFSMACGGGGGTDGSNTNLAVGPTSLTGVFSDAPVDGLTYVTTPSNLSGTTKNGGQFSYLPTDTSVTFTANGMGLGSATPGDFVTPLDIVTDPMEINTAKAAGQQNKVTKILRLLQTLDTDQNPSNGITLSNNGSLAAQTLDTIDITTLSNPVSEENAAKHFLEELDKKGKSGKSFHFTRLANKMGLTINGTPASTLLTNQWNTRKTSVETAIQAKLDAITSKGTVPGVVVKVTMPDGTNKMFASGYANVETKTAMTTANHFRLGSITKTFTDMTVLQMMTEKGYDISTTTLGDLFGGVGAAYNATTFKAAVDPNDKLTTAKLAVLKEVTVYKLLAHLSGLQQTSSQKMTDQWGAYDYTSWGLMGYLNSSLTGANSATVPNSRTTPFTAQELLDISYGIGLEETGGWHYSNANYVMLGKIIEKLSTTSNPWYTEVKNRFGAGTTLNLSIDYYADAPTPPVVPPLPGGNDKGAVGYIDWYNNFSGACYLTPQCIKDTQYPVVIHPSFYGAAGGLTGNVSDLYSWATELGKKYEDATHPIGINAYYFEVIPNVLHMGPGMFKNVDRKLVGHPGQVQGYDCYVGYRYNVKEPIAACANTTIRNSGKIQVLALNDIMDLLDGKTEAK
ncbi:MAG: beta-lactamase family protein [Magnetococcales bacterium]|nr:beta-lactamase family protein [Magnetococcales bacterium]